MSEQYLEQQETQQEEKKKKKKTVEPKLHHKDEWLDVVVEKVKPIMHAIEQNAFDKYREIGLIIMGAGYKKGQWHSYHKERFMKALKVDRSTFSLFIRLGEMSPDEFNSTKATFPSIKQWYRGGKPKSISEERQKLMQGLIARFPGEAREIKEILRTTAPYITEKELAELNTLVTRSNEDPVTVFVKNFYLAKDSAMKIPVSIMVGFEEYSERKSMPEGTTAGSVIIRKLQEILKAEGIDKNVVAQRAKLKLRMEWAH